MKDCAPIMPDSCTGFFLNHTATSVIYTLSLHDALPIYRGDCHQENRQLEKSVRATPADLPEQDRSQTRSTRWRVHRRDRKSTRLNSSHVRISYAVFCLKKKTACTRSVMI